MISPPEIVYRFFSDEGHRLVFLEGNIRLSTLEICRNHKAPWGDATEATETILSGDLKGGVMIKNLYIKQKLWVLE